MLKCLFQEAEPENHPSAGQAVRGRVRALPAQLPARDGSRPRRKFQGPLLGRGRSRRLGGKL